MTKRWPLDSDGNQVGSSVINHGNRNALRALKERRGAPKDELPVWGTDAARASNASWMAIGNEYSYLTW